ncbi:MAG: DUF192 domain-containing protein [Candidatus Aenigmatarchaeota archaeon]
MKHGGIAAAIAAIVLAAAFLMILNKPSETISVAIGGKASIAAEVAYTSEERERGLMHRSGLPEGSGMIFIFDKEGSYNFWMKNMRFPIDIIWVNQHCSVVFLTNGAPPCAAEPCKLYSADEPVKYVIEVPAGYAGRHGISAGDEAAFAWNGFRCPE